MRRTAIAGLLALIAFGGLFAFSPPAFAEPELVSSDPAHGAILTEPPEPIRLCFSEPVVTGAGNFQFKVTNPNGEPIGLRTVFQPGDVCADVYAGIPETAVKGRWTVDWMVRSRGDESEASGGFSFQYIEEDSTSNSTPKTEDDDGVDIVLVIAVGVGVAAAVVVVGGAAGAFLRRRSRPSSGGGPD